VALHGRAQGHLRRDLTGSDLRRPVRGQRRAFSN
jgi:hypothetical protein